MWLVALVIAAVSPAQTRSTAINAVIGDASWVAAFGRLPDESADETTRIRTHLRFVLHELRARDVTALPLDVRTRRAAALANLVRYIERAQFPRRTYDAYPGRRPRFIDEAGVHCAVGYLIAASGAPELARAINAEYEYAYVRNMRSAALAAWASAHGFTIDELAMIQPSYQPPDPPAPARALDPDEKRRIKTETLGFFTSKLVLACAGLGTPPERVGLEIDDHGSITPSDGEGAYARCIAKAARKLGLYLGPMHVDLALPSPQQVFDETVSTLDLEKADCWPRPGALPSEARLDIDLGAAVTAWATTDPSNAEIDTCLERAAVYGLRGFPRTLGSLHARTRVIFKSKLDDTYFPRTLADRAPDVATDCYTNDMPSRIAVTAIGKPGDEHFTIQLDPAGKAFARCYRDELDVKLGEPYSVWRDGKSYFRITRAVRASTTVVVETPQHRERRLRDERDALDRWKHGK